MSDSSRRGVGWGTAEPKVPDQTLCPRHNKPIRPHKEIIDALLSHGGQSGAICADCGEYLPSDAPISKEFKALREVGRLREALLAIAERCDRRRGDNLSMSLTWIQNKAHDTLNG